MLFPLNNQFQHHPSDKYVYITQTNILSLDIFYHLFRMVESHLYYNANLA